MAKEEKTGSEAPPTVEEWRELYAAAERLRQAKPWEWMLDSDVWGVQNPETGEIGYCCVMGNLGELFGLNLYKGTEGLEVHEMIEDGELEPGDFSLLFMQKCVQLTFGERDELDDEDLRVVKKLGLKLKGKGVWPCYRAFEPGLEPWYLTGGEARWLTVALAQVPEMLKRVKEDEEALQPPPDEPDSYLVLIPKIENGKTVWMETWRQPDPFRLPPHEPIMLDVERLERVRESGKPRDGIWEFDYSRMPIPVPADGRAFYPFMALWVDQGSGEMLQSETVEPEGHRQAIALKFCELVENAESLPREIHVGSDDAFDLVSEAAAMIGVPVRIAEELPMIDRTQGALNEILTRDPDEIAAMMRRIAEEEGFGPPDR